MLDIFVHKGYKKVKIPQKKSNFVIFPMSIWVTTIATINTPTPESGISMGIRNSTKPSGALNTMYFG